jgi:hypothetical protein
MKPKDYPKGLHIVAKGVARPDHIFADSYDSITKDGARPDSSETQSAAAKMVVAHEVSMEMLGIQPLDWSKRQAKSQ